MATDCTAKSSAAGTRECGYGVEAVFLDDVSGGGDFMRRPGMVAMLRFLKKRGHENRVVIFDDLKRFARDTVFHLKLRQELATYNATVECLNFKFEDTPEGQFVETVIAAQGQVAEDEGAGGTYVFAVPMGYRYEKAGSHGSCSCAMNRRPPSCRKRSKATPTDDFSCKRK